MKNKLIAVLLSAVIITAIFTSCGEEAVISEAAKKPELTTEPVTLTLAENFVSRERTEILREMADKYESDHKNVTVEIKTLQESGEDEMLAMLKSGEADIVELSDDNLFEYADTELLVNLEEALEYWNDSYTLTAAARDVMGSYNNTSYFVPHTIYQQALCYREDLFDEFLESIDQKKHQIVTWSDWLTYMRYAKDHGDMPYGLLYDTTKDIYQLADMIILSYVGSWNLADSYNSYYTIDNDSKTIFTFEQAKEGLKMFKELVSEMMVPLPGIGVPGDNSEISIGENFVQGDAPAIISEPSDIYHIEKNMTETIYDELNKEYKSIWTEKPLPLGNKTGQSFFMNGFDGWAASNKASDKDTAVDFLLFISDSDNNTNYVKKLGGIPVHSDAKEKDEFFIDTGTDVFITILKRPGTYQFYTPPKNYEAFNDEYIETVNSMYYQYLNDEIDEEDVLSYLDDYWRKAYEDEGQRWKFRVFKEEE